MPAWWTVFFLLKYNIFKSLKFFLLTQKPKDMKRTTFFIAIIALLAFPSFMPINTKILQEEAKNTFNYLNKLREDPKFVETETGIKDPKIKKTHSLVWNETLARVAEAKASDMATKNYFGHIDKDGRGINILIHNAGYTLNKAFLSNKSDNFFESISAGLSDGKEIIKDLIIDKNTNPPGHRYHLLAVEDFYKNCYDCGIGIAYNENSAYKYYTCIIIAKKDF